METTDDFFIPENRVYNIEEEDYKQAIPVIYTMKAIARMTYKSLYVIDYFRKNFFYVSDNPIFLCGYQPEEVLKMGYSFYFNQVPKNELKMLIEINKAGFLFYTQFTIEERMKMFVSFDCHLLNNKEQTLINHKLTPILLDDNGNIWLAACVVSLSSNQQAGNIEAHMDGRKEYWTYSLESHQWKLHEEIMLDSREKEILLYSAQNMTEEQIAYKIHLEKQTIKFHKQKLFKQLGVNNMYAAIAIAANKKMI